MFLNSNMSSIILRYMKNILNSIKLNLTERNSMLYILYATSFQYMVRENIN